MTIPNIWHRCTCNVHGREVVNFWWWLQQVSDEINVSIITPLFHPLAVSCLLCGALSPWAWPTVIGFFVFQRFTCNTVGGPWWVWSLFRFVAGQLFLQYFDAVGSVFSPVKLSPITYRPTVLVETLNPAQSINLLFNFTDIFFELSVKYN